MLFVNQVCSGVWGKAKKDNLSTRRGRSYKILLTIYLLLHNFAKTHETSTSEKVASELKKIIEKNQQSDIVVTFDVPSSETLNKITIKTKAHTDRAEKLKMISDALENQALGSQKRVLDLLKSEKSVKSRILWITNQLSIKSASAALIAEIAAVDEVTKIDIDAELEMIEPLKDPVDNLLNPPPRPRNSKYGQLTYGLETIKVPEVWSQGYYGQGINVGIIDFGIDVNHDVIRDSFIGTNNYGWFDPTNDTGLPNDHHGHGTHCLGTIVGHNGIGVAPGSRWMACEVTKDYSMEMFHTSAVACLQHFYCPGDESGRNRNCSIAPRGSSRKLYDAALPFKYSDTFLIFATGNFGPFCTTTALPQAIADIFSVGSTNYLGEVHWSSSGGPGINGSIKPAVVAPGIEVLSSCLNNTYCIKSGTSMASPHVAGIFALLLSKNPNLKNEEMWDVLINSTEPVTPTNKKEQCEKPPTSQYPNNRAGYGRINALKAIINVKIP
ncbi:unnamed protein product [Allacma fusca]|uniref:Peptidase S8/S53 domain-containing protein n=1 Tax=Allacma fusca TaxID=39272 RepID=A0A8J2NVL9_9HEXA|nr:unnamed protein product [Allacma fusca]